jgi:hypothetical protein
MITEPDVLTLILMLLAALAIGIIPFAILSKIHHGRITLPTRELATHVVSRIGTIHGLIIALVFTNTYGEMEALRANVTLEATSAADVYHDASRGGAGKDEVRKAVRHYLASVVEVEWPQLKTKRSLSVETWVKWHSLRDAALDMKATTPVEQSVRDRLLAKTWSIEDLRQQRAFNASSELSYFLWVLTIVGLALVACLMFVYEATVLNMVLMAAFALYTGLAIFMIFDIVHPFDGLTQVSPEPFSVALQQLGPPDQD